MNSVRIRSYSSPHFPAFRVNTGILRKMRTRITPNIDNFYVVRTGKTNQKCLKVLTKNITFNHFHPNIHFAKNVVFQANLKILPILCLKLYQSREMKQSYNTEIPTSVFQVSWRLLLDNVCIFVFTEIALSTKILVPSIIISVVGYVNLFGKYFVWNFRLNETLLNREKPLSKVKQKRKCYLRKKSVF